MHWFSGKRSNRRSLGPIVVVRDQLPAPTRRGTQKDFVEIFPEEISYRIVGLLSEPERLDFSLVCREWQQLVAQHRQIAGACATPKTAHSSQFSRSFVESSESSVSEVSGVSGVSAVSKSPVSAVSGSSRTLCLASHSQFSVESDRTLHKMLRSGSKMSQFIHGLTSLSLVFEQIMNFEDLDVVLDELTQLMGLYISVTTPILLVKVKQFKTPKMFSNLDRFSFTVSPDFYNYCGDPRDEAHIVHGLFSQISMPYIKELKLMDVAFEEGDLGSLIGSHLKVLKLIRIPSITFHHIVREFNGKHARLEKLTYEDGYLGEETQKEKDLSEPWLDLSFLSELKFLKITDHVLSVKGYTQIMQSTNGNLTSVIIK